MIPHAEPSAIKAAVLSQPLRNTEPARIAWTNCHAAESLAARTAQCPTDPTLFDRLTGQEPIIRATPVPLASPIGEPDLNQTITSDSAGRRSRSTQCHRADRATASNRSGRLQTLEPDHIGLCDQSIRFDPAIRLLIMTANLPTIVSDCEDTPEGWLAHAQDAATNAESTEELVRRHRVVRPRTARHALGRSCCRRSAHLSAWAHNRRGEMLADAQHSDDAIQDFQVAISMDPNCSLAIHNRAVTLAQRNQFAAALRDFNRVIELNPGLAVAYRNRAELLAALGRMDDAVADYDQAIATLADDAALHRARRMPISD